MRNGFLFLALLCLLLAAACSKAANVPMAGGTASPAPPAIAVTPPAASVAASPGVAGVKGPVDPKAQGSLPPALFDRFRRGLTDEEIRRLPPETRDMILRAQGKLPPSPTPLPKKK